MDVFITLIVVMVSQVNIDVQTQLTVYIKHVKAFVSHLYLNKAEWNENTFKIYILSPTAEKQKLTYIFSWNVNHYNVLGEKFVSILQN